MTAILKIIHVGTAFVSIALFAWRWRLALRNSPLLRRRWLINLPRANDSLLLAAAIGLAVRTGQNPFLLPWLEAKLLALLLYIVLGTLALRAWNQSLRRAAGVAALATVLYIVSVAVAKDARGFLLALE